MKQVEKRSIGQLDAFARQGTTLLASLFLLLLAACGGEKKEQPAGSGASADSGAMNMRTPVMTIVSDEPIIIAMPADAVKLDPPQSTDGNTLLIMEHIYDRLTQFADDDEVRVEPGLAKSWDISPDGLTYTFHLRDDATFSNGHPVTSECVKFTYERIVDENHPQHYSIAWTSDILGNWFDHIEAPDPHTVVFKLKRPFVPLLFNLAMPAGSIVDPEHVKSVGPDRIVTEPMGSGPYTLKDWKRGDYVMLEARETHWRSKPRNKTLIFRVQKDPNQVISSLKRGETHAATVVNSTVIGKDRDFGDFAVVDVPIHSLGYAIFNVNKENLKSVPLRQALNYAIDRQSICDGLLQGSSVPAEGVLPPGMIGYREKRPFSYNYDPEKAKKLIEDNGLKGTKIKMLCFDADRPYNVAGVKLAQRLQEDWRKIGVEVTLEQMDFGGFLDTVDQRTVHELALSGWMADTGDPDNFIYYVFGPGNRSNYVNEKSQKLMEDAQAVQDPAKRAEMYQQAEDIIMQDAPIVVINHAKRLKGVSKRLKGYNANVIMSDMFWNAYLE